MSSEEKLTEVPTKVASKKSARKDEVKKGYVQLKELGRGGMGKVLLVQDVAFDRQIAMKVVLPACQKEHDLLQRFFNESKITAQLDHPSIPPVHNCGINSSGMHYFTMKYVQGMSLAKVLDSLCEGEQQYTQEYSLNHLIQIFLKICEAMAFAHEKGIIHRDLKPENIMLGKFGEVFVMDWGLAKSLGSQEQINQNQKVSTDPMLSTDGMILGTPAYMSPEQADGRIQDVNELSDIYSLGAILYEILTLQQPLEGETAIQIIYKASKGLVKAPRKRAPQRNIPKDLEAICLKAMSKKPKFRYQNVQDLIVDIKAFLEQKLVSSYKYSFTEISNRWLQKHTALVVASIAFFAVMGIGFSTSLLFWSRAKNEQLRSANLEVERKHAVEQKEYSEVERKVAVDQRDYLKETSEQQRQAETILSTMQYLTPGPKYDQSVLDIIEKANTCTPDFWKVYFERAQHHLKYSRFDLAFVDLEKASDLHLKQFGSVSSEIWFNPGMRFGLPRELNGLDRPDEALKYLEKANFLEPEAIYGKLSKVAIVVIKSQKEMEVSSKEFSESLSFLEKLTKDPISQNVEYLWLLRAWIYGACCFVKYQNSPLLQFKDLLKAREAIEYTLKIQKDASVCLVNFHGSLLLLTDSPDQAILAFNRCIQADQSPSLYYNRGLAYYKLQDFEKAEKDFERYLVANPTDQKARKFLESCKSLQKVK